MILLLSLFFCYYRETILKTILVCFTFPADTKQKLPLAANRKKNYYQYFHIIAFYFFNTFFYSLIITYNIIPGYILRKYDDVMKKE